MSEQQTSDSPPPSKRRFGCIWVFVAFCLLGLGWCHYTPLNRFSSASLRALRSDSEAVFYSIEPWPEENLKQGFRGHQIVGQYRLAAQSDRDAIADMISGATHGAWDAAACFDPRHAFRARGSDGIYDFLLCFQCGEAVVYRPDGKTDSIFITGKADFLNDFLRSHAVPLPQN
jgi:hypothetical protein